MESVASSTSTRTSPSRRRGVGALDAVGVRLRGARCAGSPASADVVSTASGQPSTVNQQPGGVGVRLVAAEEATQRHGPTLRSRLARKTDTSARSSDSIDAALAHSAATAAAHGVLPERRQLGLYRAAVRAAQLVEQFCELRPAHRDAAERFRW